MPLIESPRLVEVGCTFSPCGHGAHVLETIRHVGFQGYSYDEIPGYTKEETAAIYERMRDVVCMPVKAGTHYQATSTK